jgi:hypothetical protein
MSPENKNTEDWVAVEAVYLEPLSLVSANYSGNFDDVRADFAGERV